MIVNYKKIYLQKYRFNHHINREQLTSTTRDTTSHPNMQLIVLSALFALGIIISEHSFRTVEQPHLGQDREGESVLNFNAPSMYANTASGRIGYTWKPSALTPTITLPLRG